MVVTYSVQMPEMVCVRAMFCVQIGVVWLPAVQDQREFEKLLLHLYGA